MSCSAPSQSSLLYYLDENTFLTTLTSLTFAVIGIFIFIFSSYIYFDKHKIPKGSLPKVPYGNIKDVVSQHTTLYDYLRKYYNRFRRKGFRYGGLYLFFKPAVLIVDLTLQKFVFTNENENHDKLECIKNAINSTNIRCFFEKMKRNKDTLRKCIDVKNAFEDSLHVWLLQITRETFGNTIEDTFLMDLLRHRTSSRLLYFINMAYPYFRRKTSFNYLRHSIDDIVAYRKKNDLKQADILESISSNVRFDDIINLFIDNITFTHSSVLWGLCEIANNEDIQEDLVGEIRRFNKEDVDITLESLEKLSYLDAVVKEILRKYPPVPVVIQNLTENHENPEYGFKLPKNILVMSTIFGLHHDANYYSDPECFDPDRFSEDKTFIKPDSYIPFGYAPEARICASLTVMSIKMIIFSILSRYRIALTKKFTLTFDNDKLNVQPKGPLPLEFVLIETDSV